MLSLVSTVTTEAVPSRLRCLSAPCRVPEIATSITEPREATPDAQHRCNARTAAFHRQLASQVAPLQSEWQGVAQARFQELWAEWQRSSRGIQEALHGISQLTQQAGTNYADTEQGIASSFGR